jgi:aminopeptidase N
MKHAYNCLFLLSACLAMLLASCSPRSPSSTPDPLPSATLADAAPTPASSPTASAVPVTPTPEPPARAQYTLDATINYFAKKLTVNETVVYPNRAGEALTELVLAVEPNLWYGGFVLQSAAVDGRPPANFDIDGQRLTITLSQPLEAGALAELTLVYTLILPRSEVYTDPNDVRPQIYGFTDRQVNLVDWYPFVVPYVPGSGWLLHNPWFYGEHLVYDAADFDVTLRFVDPAVIPVIASSGEQIPAVDSFHYHLQNGRTFALSMSSQFEVESKEVGDVTVYSYYFPFYKGSGHGVLETTASALEIFGEEFGSYPHKTLSAVQGDFDDGMEYSGLYFLSRDFYNLYDGTPRNYLTIIAAHETAHQWWFDAVANDQALEPWLDESLATYSEHVFLENAFPDDVSWWWSFRYFPPAAADGAVDTAIYDAGGYRPYLNAVYLNGAKFHEDIRTRIGDDDFFAFLQDLYRRKAGGRLTADEYFEILAEHTSVNVSDIIADYFQTPP